MPRYYNDSELEGIEPTQIADYLLSRGWSLQEQIEDKATVWDSADRSAEVWIPLRPSLQDYRRLMSESFQVLEQLEHRPIRSIIQDLSLSSADISRFRVQTGMFRTPTLPLSDGVALVRAARDAIVSAARWLVEPKAAYYSRPLAEVSRFLRNLRLGQTEIGSYVVTVISPLTSETPPEFARDSMLQVYQSIQAARGAAIKATASLSLDSFDAAAREGVSANLCDALVGLAGASPDNAVELQFAWSPRIQVSGEPRQTITLNSEMIRTLKPAAERLRALEPEPRATVRGLVREMTDRTAADRQSQVTVVAEIDEVLRRVRFVLRGEFRQHAIDAFDRRLPLIITGTLNRSGQPYTFDDISDVRVVGEDEEVMRFDFSDAVSEGNTNADPNV